MSMIFIYIYIRIPRTLGYLCWRFLPAKRNPWSPASQGRAPLARAGQGALLGALPAALSRREGSWVQRGKADAGREAGFKEGRWAQGGLGT